MNIKIQTDKGIIEYDVSKIKDDKKKSSATVTVQKVGQLEVMIEALSFASSTHRKNLEALMKDCPEALVKSKDKNEKK